jgi:hypothetical protein
VLILGISSVARLRENIVGAALTLTADAVAELAANLSSGRPRKGVAADRFARPPPSAEGGDRNGNRAIDAQHNRRKPS